VKRYSVRVATWFALAGLGLGAALLFAMGMQELLAWFPISIAAGSVAALCLARWLAGVYSPHLQRAALFQAALLGVVVALGCVIGGTLTGALVQIGIDWAQGRIVLSTPASVLEALLGPLLWVLYVGLVPAVLLGCAFGVLVRRKGRQVNASEGA
jgi:hypothetical protein